MAVPRGGRAHDLADLQALLAADYDAVAAAKCERLRGPEAAEVAGAAVADEVFDNRHGRFPLVPSSAYAKPKNSDMTWSYTSWPRSVLKSSRISLMTLML